MSSCPCSDLTSAIEFYRDQVGFNLDHRTTNEHMDVAQLTPEGSGCSIVIGNLPVRSRRWRRGSMRGLQLVVADARCSPRGARRPRRGVQRVTVFDERDGGTFFGFSDPDGNTWAIQQLKARGDKPLIPLDHRGRFGDDA